MSFLLDLIFTTVSGVVVNLFTTLLSLPFTALSDWILTALSAQN